MNQNKQAPLESGAFDAAISGLMLNFVPDPLAAAREMARVTKPGGCVAAYVWDYSAGMQMMRTFWDTAIAVDPDSAALDQAERFPLCSPGPLQDLLISAGLQYVAVRAIDIPTVFQNFDGVGVINLSKVCADKLFQTGDGFFIYALCEEFQIITTFI